jgi:phage terminase Nu1 subunit (DNA packaging protein)
VRDKSTEQIGEIFDVGESTLRNWVRDGCPCDKGGKGKPRLFDEAEVAAWMRSKNLTGDVGKPKEIVSDELEKARIRKDNALANKFELQVERERGLVIERAEVERLGVQKVVTVRNRLMVVGSKLAAQLNDCA